MVQLNSTTQIHNIQGTAFIASTKAKSTFFPGHNKEHSCNRSYEELFLETVDSAFLLMGESCMQAIYRQLEKHYDIKRQSIPWKIEAFAKALEDIFGQGARLLEIRIMHALHDSLRGFKYSLDQEEFSFKGYIEAVRRFLQS